MAAARGCELLCCLRLSVELECLSDKRGMQREARGDLATTGGAAAATAGAGRQLLSGARSQGFSTLARAICCSLLRERCCCPRLTPR